MIVTSAASAARALAKFLRRHPGLLAEEPGEVGLIEENERVGNVLDRLRGEHELMLGLGQHALADQMAGGDAERPLDMVIEAIV